MVAFVDFNLLFPALSATQTKDTEDSIQDTFGTAAEANKDQNDQCGNDANDNTCDGTTAQATSAIILGFGDDGTIGAGGRDVTLGRGNLTGGTGGGVGQSRVACRSVGGLGSVGDDGGHGLETAVESGASTTCVFALARRLAKLASGAAGIAACCFSF